MLSLGEVVEPLLDVALSEHFALVGAVLQAVLGVVVDLRHWSWDLTVVGLGVEVDDVGSVLDELDARDEGLALDSVDVQVVWLSVRGGKEDYTVLVAQNRCD